MGIFFDFVSWFWILLIIFIIVMFIIPIRYGKKEFLLGSVKNPIEKEEYKELKSHNQTLAGFTMAALAIVIAFPYLGGQDPNRLAAFYFAISLMCFFVASYLFDYRIRRIFPYLGQVLEYTGIISLAFGFLSFAYAVFKNDFFVLSIYLIFMISISVIAVVEIYYNKKFFEP